MKATNQSVNRQRRPQPNFINRRIDIFTYMLKERKSQLDLGINIQLELYWNLIEFELITDVIYHNRKFLFQHNKVREKHCYHSMKIGAQSSKELTEMEPQLY